jgi:glycosyltransferase involved in cell wall biosynthesis
MSEADAADASAAAASTADRPLRVVYSDPHERGGGQVRYVVNLAAEMARMGHHSTVACRPGSLLEERCRENGLDVAAEFQFARRMGANWLHDWARARRLLQELRPDVLHVSGSQDHWLLAAANQRLGHPAALVRTRHNTYAVQNHLLNRLLNRRWTDFQISVCALVRDRLAQQSAFDSRRLRAIHNGVDAERFRPDADARERLRAELGYAPGDVVCGIAARLDPAKGHEFLFRAAAFVRERLPDLRLLVLGEGRLQADLKALARELGIAERVAFAGHRSDMAEVVQAFDFGVQPSVDCDTSSFSTKEQMAAGKAVAVSDFGGLPEIVDDGVEGLVVPAGEVEPLARALHKLTADGEARQSMGAAGRARVLREFTLEAFARRTEAVYREALVLRRGADA